jgi:hypothetical protein
MPNNWTREMHSDGIEYGYDSEINPDYAADAIYKKIIGINGVLACDFNFAAPANAVAQTLITGQIPAQCKIISASIRCLAASVGAVDIKLALGVTPSGVEIIPYTTCILLGSIINNGVIPVNINWAVPNVIYIKGDPQGTNWNGISLGQWLITVNYKNFSNL